MVIVREGRNEMDELISRQAVIDHINKKREEHLESADLISRQAAILALAEQIMESALMDNPTTASTDIDRYRPIAELSLRDAPSAQSEIIRCKDCMHNGSFDTDCPIDWNGKEYCSFAERKEDE